MQLHGRVELRRAGLFDELDALIGRVLAAPGDLLRELFVALAVLLLWHVCLSPLGSRLPTHARCTATWRRSSIVAHRECTCHRHDRRRLAAPTRMRACVECGRRFWRLRSYRATSCPARRHSHRRARSATSRGALASCWPRAPISRTRA